MNKYGGWVWGARGKRDSAPTGWRSGCQLSVPPAGERFRSAVSEFPTPTPTPTSSPLPRGGFHSPGPARQAGRQAVREAAANGASLPIGRTNAANIRRLYVRVRGSRVFPGR